MEQLLEIILKYYEALCSLFDLNDLSITSPAPVPQAPDIQSLKSDGALFANQIFPAAAPRIPAREIALSEMYDTTQSFARIADVYAASRSDYYNQAVSSTNIVKERTQYKKKIISDMLSTTNTPRLAFENIA